MTYRKNFPKLPNSSQTSDKGWGCMVRCGQNILAECLIRHAGPSFNNLRGIVELFRDSPERAFSIHNIITQAIKLYKMEAGQWFAPTRVLYCLKEIFDTSKLIPAKLK